jgi:hypothetical protein
VEGLPEGIRGIRRAKMRRDVGKVYEERDGGTKRFSIPTWKRRGMFIRKKK